MSNRIGFDSTSRTLASTTGAKTTARRLMGSDPKTSSDELSLKIKLRMPFLKRIANFWNPKSELKNTHKIQVDLVSDRSEIP